MLVDKPVEEQAEGNNNRQDFKLFKLVEPNQTSHIYFLFVEHIKTETVGFEPTVH